MVKLTAGLGWYEDLTGMEIECMEAKVSSANQIARAYADSSTLRQREEVAEAYLYRKERAHEANLDARMMWCGVLCILLLFWFWLVPLLAGAAKNAPGCWRDGVRVYQMKGGR